MPWPNLPTAVNQALTNWAQTNQREFEKIVASRAEQAGFTYSRPSLTPRKAAQRGLAIRGEIDLLLADPDRQRVWVIEAKYPNMPYGPDRIYREIEDFHSRAKSLSSSNGQGKSSDKAYIDNLLAKRQAVENDVAAALDIVGIGLDGRSLDWEVRALMVTPHPVAAAYVDDPRVPFSTVDELADTLSADDGVN